MIHLEHINLVVDDIPAALRFYQAAFPHWRVRGGDKGTWYGKTRNWIHFGDDYQYIAFSDNGEGENRDLAGHQIGLAHFAFVTDNLDAVIARLTQAVSLLPKMAWKIPIDAIFTSSMPMALKSSLSSI